MNLVRDPWIPVVGIEEKSRFVSLDDVFRKGDEIADIAANPCQRIALMRLLICIGQAALDGPKDEDDWRSCRPRLVIAALDYLEKWQNRFNLFGEHAFLQVDGLEVNNNALVDKLDLTLANGHNPTLFDQSASCVGRIPQNCWRAINLLVYQMFSPGGLIGTTNWNGLKTVGKSEHAPCLEGSMLHTFVIGKTLSDTIHLNLLTRNQIEMLPNATWGKPCWEIDVRSLVKIEQDASTYLGRLVAMPRAIYCVDASNKITLSNGAKYPKLPECREPTGTVRRIRKGASERLAYVAVNPERNPWREIGSILALKSADTPGGALALHHLREIKQGIFNIWTGGLAAKKAKLVDMAEWNFTFPIRILDTLTLKRYEDGVVMADSGDFTLRLSVKKYSGQMNNNAIWARDAQKQYWAFLDGRSEVLSDYATDKNSQLLKKWQSLIRDSMHSAYELVCPHETPRQIQSYAQGMKILDSWKP